MADRLPNCCCPGRTPRFQRYDWDSHRLTEWVDVPLTPVVLLEGVSSARAVVAADLSYCVWIATPREIRLQRGLARDGTRARAQWHEWMAAEDHHFDRDGTPRRADLHVDGDPHPQPADPEHYYAPLDRESILTRHGLTQGEP